MTLFFSDFLCPETSGGPTEPPKKRTPPFGCPLKHDGDMFIKPQAGEVMIIVWTKHPGLDCPPRLLVVECKKTDRIFLQNWRLPHIKLTL